MKHWQEISPYLIFGIAIVIGFLTGNWLVKKTGRKVIGWPIGLAVVLILFIVLPLLNKMIIGA
jgi:predicted MFS family arabinose efflux permease